MSEKIEIDDELLQTSSFSTLKINEKIDSILIHSMDFPFESTACYRSYIGTWSIVNRRLFLNNLSGKKYSLLTTEPVFADWVTGYIKVYRLESVQVTQRYMPTREIPYATIEIIEGHISQLQYCLNPQTRSEFISEQLNLGSHKIRSERSECAFSKSPKEDSVEQVVKNILATISEDTSTEEEQTLEAWKQKMEEVAPYPNPDEVYALDWGGMMRYYRYVNYSWKNQSKVFERVNRNDYEAYLERRKRNKDLCLKSLLGW